MFCASVVFPIFGRAAGCAVRAPPLISASKSVKPVDGPVSPPPAFVPFGQVVDTDCRTGAISSNSHGSFASSEPRARLRLTDDLQRQSPLGLEAIVHDRGADLDQAPAPRHLGHDLRVRPHVRR